MASWKTRKTRWVRFAVAAAVVTTAPACRTEGPRPTNPIQSRFTAERIAAARSAALRGETHRVAHLVDRLEDEDPAVRFASLLALERLTGQRMGYHYGDPPERRAEAVARWRRYVAESVVPETRTALPGLPER